MPDVVALVFDFDDTLVPDSTSAFLKFKGVSTKRFWLKDTKALIERGYDYTLAFLNIFLDKVGSGRPLGVVSNADLRRFGKRLNSTIYPGLKTFFRDVRKTVARFPDIKIEFYIISGGLKPMIEGTSLAKEMTAIYGCELDEGGTPPSVSRIKRVVSFTEKTRYLFEINKGLPATKTVTDPLLVNTAVDDAKRRIPFKNILYVGDGLTDIPCFSLVKRSGGEAWGIFHAGDEKSERRALLELLRGHRVSGVNQPRYGAKQDLGSMLRTVVFARCSQIVAERSGALK